MNLHLVTRAEPLPLGSRRAGQALRLLTGVRTTGLRMSPGILPLGRPAHLRRPAPTPP